MLYNHGATTLQKSLFCIFALVGLGAALAACGSEPLPTPAANTPSDAGPDVETPDAGMSDVGEMTCPVGHAPGSNGECQPIGIQGCAPRFIDPDGVCRPSMAKCADMPGTIPKFDEGCIPVGITNCAPEFIEDDGLCHPRMQKCAGKPGTFAVPQLGCVPIDGPLGCGSGTWGNIVDEPGNVYVDANSQGPTYDGSKAHPFKTVSEAVQAVQPGGRIALAAGLYDGSITIEKPLILEGRCPSMVHLDNTSLSETIYIHNTSDVTVRGVGISGNGYGLRADNAKTTKIEYVHVKAAHFAGIIIRGVDTSLDIGLTIVEGTLPDQSTKELGHGIDIGSGAQVSISHSAILGNISYGIVAGNPGTNVNILNTLVEGTTPSLSNGYGGYGILPSDGATLKVHSSAIVKNHASGVSAHNPGTWCEVEECLVEETGPQAPPDRLGLGIDAVVGATTKATHNAVLANMSTGMHAWANEATLETWGNYVAYTVPPPGKRNGAGIGLFNSTHGIHHYDVLYRNRGIGFIAYQGITSANATGIVVEQTLPSPDTGEDGAGLLVFFTTGDFLFDSCAIIDNAIVGIGFAIAHGTVNHCLVSGTKAGDFIDDMGKPHTDFGDGIGAALATTLHVTSSITEHTARAGFLYDESEGSIDLCESHDHGYGFVFQRMPKPSFILEQNAAYNNKYQDFLFDGDLAVPVFLP